MIKVVACASCEQAIVWLRTPRGDRMPTNASTVHEGDRLFDHSKHVSHFATCPDAAKWRKPKEPHGASQR